MDPLFKNNDHVDGCLIEGLQSSQGLVVLSNSETVVTKRFELIC